MRPSSKPLATPSTPSTPAATSELRSVTGDARTELRAVSGKTLHDLVRDTKA
jgi:hypothetical protein